MLFPIIIPKRYNKNNNWIGPIRNLLHSELAVTWVDMHESSMSYLTHAQANKLVDNGIDYHEQAMDNLWEQTYNNFYTGRKEENGIFKFAVLMHQDGLGSSRLLFLPEWKEEFPEGFQFALPERSCALVIPQKQVSDESTQELIQQCYSKGTVPMLPGIHSSDLLRFE